MQITHAFGLAGAADATGPTIVIDVFRAFSAAAYALAAGARQIVLAEAIDEAVHLARGLPGSILMGEDGGVRPAEFHLGNSPGEIVTASSIIRDKTIVHRSSSGTRCATSSGPGSDRCGSASSGSARSVSCARGKSSGCGAPCRGGRDRHAARKNVRKSRFELDPSCCCS